MRLTGILVVTAAAAVLACDDGPRIAEFENGGSFVADDAGRIPLTSPGTAPRTEREVIGVPIPPVDYLPAAPEERPFEADPAPFAPDTAIRRAPAERQQRTADTLRIEQQGTSAPPLVRPPQPAAPSSQPRATTPPPAGRPADTGRVVRPPPASQPPDTGGAGATGAGGTAGAPDPGNGGAVSGEGSAQQPQTDGGEGEDGGDGGS